VPGSYTASVADFEIRAASVLRKELASAITALQSTPRAVSANPQVGDFAGRLQAELDQTVSKIGELITQNFDNTLIQLLNLASLSGLILASVPNNIKAGQSGTGTFVLSNLGTNPITGLELIAGEMSTLAGGNGSGGPTIASSQVTFSPNPVSIGPRSSITVTVQVAVPSGQNVANYYGSILDAANGQVKGLLSIAVD
jgi:hypothetical protein